MRRWLTLIVLTLVGLEGTNMPRMPIQALYSLNRTAVDPAIVVEPTQGPWKRNFNWGGAFNEAMPVAPGAEIPLFSSEDIPGPPRVQSIVLQRNFQAEPGTNADFRARVYYSIGATTDSFECDWTRGAQFTLVANYVRVTAVTYAPSLTDPYDPTTNGVPGGPLAKVIIGAGIAEGTVLNTEPLTYTEPLNPVANGTTVQVNAPDFARALIVNSPNDTIPTPSLISVRVGGGVNAFSRWTYDELRANYPRGVLLPGGTRYLLLTNNSGAIRSMSITWVLGL